jgi:hypothetical protein
MSPALRSTYFPDSAEVETVETAVGSRAAYRYACYAVLAAALIFFAAIRFHFRNMPLERDEGEYAYMGQLLLQGVPPYKLAYTMKLPGTSMAYAAMMAVFGQTVAGIRIGMIVVTTLCSLLVFLLGKRLCGLLAGTIAGITYVFLAIRPGVLGMDGHATHFVVLAALAGLLLFLRAIDHPRVILFFASGLLFGLSFLMKQPGIFFGLFAGCYWLWREWKNGWRWQNALPRGAALIAGTVLPYAMVCWWMLQAGVFANFWFWTWTYARAYGSITSLSDSWRLYLRYTLPWAVRPFILWEIALAGLVAPLWSRVAREHGGFVAGFFLTSALAVCPGLYFRPHYFILLLPAVALCVGIAVECARREQERRELERRNGRSLAFVPVLLFAVAYLFSVHGQWKTYFRLDPPALARKIHYDQPYSEAVEAADFIKVRANSEDEIGIIGSEPEVCFYTRLRCATSYLYMYPLMEKQPFDKRMQSDMLNQLQTARQRFLIYEDDERAWGWSSTLHENRPFFERAWTFAHSYDLVLQIPAPPVDASYSAYLYGSGPTLYLFERR